VTSSRSVLVEGQEIGDERRRVRNLLEIVEHQQGRVTLARRTHASRQVGRADIRQAQRFGNRACRKPAIPNGSQWREHDARRTFVLRLRAASSNASRVFPTHRCRRS
jgi:hypothetical protein